MLLALILAATPQQCTSLWPSVWKAWSAQQASPPAEAAVKKAWLVECKAFKKILIDCGTGVLRDKALKEIRDAMEKEGLPLKYLDEAHAKVRAEWTPLDSCEPIQASMDRAALAAGWVPDAGVPLDAGVPKSDDCMGDDLTSGKCQCAHSQCMDTCCPEGWVCAHSGAATAKCIRPH